MRLSEAELHRLLDAAVAQVREHFPDATEIKPIYANGLPMAEVWHGRHGRVVNPEQLPPRE